LFVNRQIQVLVMLLSVACGLTACNHSKSSAEVAKDTSAAQQTAGEKVAAAQQQAAVRIASARGDVREEQRDLNHVDAVESQKVAETAAAGEHKVALVRCEGLSGSPQKSCKDRADADYEAAEARARQDRAATDPKP
jgi:ABC-type enterochelin transport system substrate-binding protein